MTNNVSVELLIEHVQKQCNRYTNGQCSTLRCLRRGGYTETAPPEFGIATCEEHEIALALSRPSPTPSDGPPYAADDWQAKGYASPEAEIDDMANVGRALMEALPKGYSYNDCPSEIVVDLLNQIDELKATPSEDVVERLVAILKHRIFLNDRGAADGGPEELHIEGHERAAREILQALARLSPLPLVGED